MIGSSTFQKGNTLGKYIAGIDVSKKRLDITIFDGIKEKSYDIPYTQTSFQKIMKQYNSDALHVVCEATGNYHLHLGQYSRDMGLRFSSVNPFIIKRYSDIQMKRAKTDRIDSGLIAHYGYDYSPKLTVEISPTRVKMKQLLKAIEDLHQTEQGYRNRLEAHSVHPHGVSEVEDTYNQILAFTEKKRKKLETELIHLATESHLTDFNLLMSIPGIGPIGAAVIIAFFGRFETFDTSKQVISFIGTNPSVIQSGQFKGKSSISRKGNGYIRKKLYMCAISASRNNPQCVQLYNRLLEKGMAKKPAMVAVMNKLIRQAFGVSKSQKPYSPNQ